MNVNKLMQKMERHYVCHGVNIKLTLLEIIGNYDRFIFRFKLKAGTKESLIFDRAPDIKTALQLPLFKPFKNGLNICLAVSEKPVTQNSLFKMLTSNTFQKSKDWLPIALGYDMRCEMLFADLGKMPHAMYAGSTNSGKSVGLMCLILSLIFKLPVSKVNLILFDVGANTMEPFCGIPHLSHPIVKDTVTGIYVVEELVEEMEKRIKLDREELRKLPAIVCVMDEYVSFITNIGNKALSKELTNAISNLLRRGRHAKIHMVLATQDPTIKNMKVDIGNITSRMAFFCAKYHNSITILGEGGAEKLTGKGTMLFKSNEHPNPIHLQGAYIFSDEVKHIVTRIASASHDNSNKFEIQEFEMSQNQPQEDVVSDCQLSELGRKKEFIEIIMWTLGLNIVSAKKIRECFSIGNRSYDILDELFQINLIEDKNFNQPREVLPKCIEDIPSEVKELLYLNGTSTEEIEAVFSTRKSLEVKKVKAKK